LTALQTKKNKNKKSVSMALVQVQVLTMLSWQLRPMMSLIDVIMVRNLGDVGSHFLTPLSDAVYVLLGEDMGCGSPSLFL